MKQYIWFHPAYVKQAQSESSSLLSGQIKNAVRHGYTVLGENQLGLVSAHYHLTIVGHTTPPEDDSLAENDGEDDGGLFIQGETSKQLVERLVSLGLKKAPRILSLECCRAAIENGLAQQLSSQPFFKGALIEANKGGIGRDPGTIFKSLVTDGFGRAVIGASGESWIYFRAGAIVKTRAHSNEKISEILSQLEDFHDRFFQHYNPGSFRLGWLGAQLGLGGEGRAGRYCKETGLRLTREKAEELAKQGPAESATAQALKAVESSSNSKPRL